MIRKLFRVAMAVLLALPTAVSAQPLGPKAFVLDSEGKSVVALDMATGAVVGRVAIEGTPGFMVLGLDGARLVVLDPGAGKTTMRFGYHPTSKASATLIDTASLEVISRIELGWNLMGLSRAVAAPASFMEPPLLSPDGKRLNVLCPGYRSQRPEETLPVEVVTVDLDTGRIAGRVTLDRRADEFLALPDGTTALAFSGRETRKDAAALPAEAAVIDLSVPKVAARLTLQGSPERPLLAPDGKRVVFLAPRQTPKKEPAVPATIQFVDLGTREVVATRTVEGTPGEAALSPDGKHLYVLEKGSPNKKPEKNIAGRIQVFTMETASHEINHEAGTDPRGLIVDKEGQQVLVLSEGAPSVETKAPEGELRVLRGAEITATVKVAAEPIFLRISPDRARLYVVGEQALTHVELAGLRRIADTPMKPAGLNILAADSGKHTVSELAVSDDGRRGFALYSGSSKLSVLDLESQKLIGEVTTGRGGKKFAKFMGAFALSVAMTAASQSLGRSTAMSTGSPYYTYNIYNFQIAAPNSTLAVRPDGKFSYALNSQTNDVTIVDADTGQVVDKIPGGGQAIKLFTGGAILAVRDKDALRFIDTATNKKGEELAFPGSSAVSLAFSEDGAHAVAAGGATLYCLDGTSGKVRARHTSLKRAVSVVVAATPAREPSQ